jgi:alkanesulfonate monooxygenase SsuD/methylene tetrahydromethanopterin reductase-like flavin-dependent oxidoreductase (luciferase family)
LVPDVNHYRDACAAANHPGHGEIYLRLAIHVSESDAQAKEEARESTMAGYQKLTGQLEGAANLKRKAEIESSARMSYEHILQDKVVVGSPETVADRLLQLQDLLGIDGILAELNFGAQIPAPQMKRSLELLCKEVRPRVNVGRRRAG